MHIVFQESSEDKSIASDSGCGSSGWGSSFSSKTFEETSTPGVFAGACKDSGTGRLIHIKIGINNVFSVTIDMALS